MVEGETKGNLDLITVDGDNAKIETIKDGFDGPVSLVQVGDTIYVLDAPLRYLLGPEAKEKKPAAALQGDGCPSAKAIAAQPGPLRSRLGSHRVRRTVGARQAKPCNKVQTGEPHPDAGPGNRALIRVARKREIILNDTAVFVRYGGIFALTYRSPIK